MAARTKPATARERLVAGQARHDVAGAEVGDRDEGQAGGFVLVGNGLWETTGGGGHWAPAAYLGGFILSRAAIDGQLLALTAVTGSIRPGGIQPGAVLHRSRSRPSWCCTRCWPSRHPKDVAAASGRR